MKKLNKKGFTLVELMIATSVFSIVLLVCMGAIIYVGRLYYKGISITATIEVARESLENVSEAVQFSGEDVITLGPMDGWDKGYCISGVKYSAKLNTQLVLDSPGTGQSDRVLVTSPDPACTISSSPEPIGSTNRELLRPDMRLTAFGVFPSGDGLVDIEVGVAFGGDTTDNTVEINSFNFATTDDPSTAILSCKGSGSATAFCATTYLNTSVIRRVR